MDGKFKWQTAPQRLRTVLGLPMTQLMTSIIAFALTACGSPVPPVDAPDASEDIDAAIAAPDVVDAGTDSTDAVAVDDEAADADPPDGDAVGGETKDGSGSNDADAFTLPSDATVTVTADTASLTPPPLSTWFTATVGGNDVTKLCSWTIGPPDICVLTPPNGAHRTGFGTCKAACSLPGGASGTLSLKSAAQPVLYILGGWNLEYLTPDIVHPGISRLRITDKQWDAYVAPLPYVLSNAAVGGDAEHLYVVGGTQPGGTAGADAPVQKCASDLPGCTGAQCLSPCMAWDDGVGPLWKCPKESVAKPALGGGCGTIWRLDLADASWHAVDSLPLNTSYVHANATLGSNLYLITTGNGLGGSLPQYALDLTTGVKTALGAPLLTPIVAPFGKKLAMGDWPSGIDVWTPGDATLQPFAPSPPCPALTSGGGLVSFQSPQPTLVWTTGWRADLANCPKGSTLDYSKPLAFRTWLSTSGSWTPGPMMPMNVADANLILAVGWDGGVFYIPRWKPEGASALQPTWLLAAPGDHFEEFPPPPAEHQTTMAVVVIQ